MRAMVGGCCVCSDEQGWNENPLVYCDGQGCTVAVHQACYGIVTVPTGPWYCRKCESQERAARVRCELCPSKDGALKRTDNGGWAHVVCALYIPEVRFGNVATMEPIILALVPQERYNKVCYLCLENSGRESKASHGACMQCNKAGCKDSFHVTCAQAHGLLCEEAGNYMDNVKYCGYCDHHFQRINKKLVKTIPAFRPQSNDDDSPESSPEKQHNPSLGLKEAAKHLQASSSALVSKGKGKRGRKPGSMIYEPKLEPPKFNPDLASLSSSNNCLNSVNNSVTLTPVSSSFSNSDHKTSGTSFCNSEPSQVINKDNKVFSDNKSAIGLKTPNVVVKIGKHGEIYHAKKDSPVEVNHTVSTAGEPLVPPEAILERVPITSSSNCEEVKEESEKKGFTTANFTESFVTASVSVTAALIKSDSEKSPLRHPTPGAQADKVLAPTSVKLECPDPGPESSDRLSPAPIPVTEVYSDNKEHSVSSTSSSQQLPQPKALEPKAPEPKVQTTQSQNSSGLSFSLEPNLASSRPIISSTNSTSVTNMFSRTSQLNNSVSLFPTSSSGRVETVPAQSQHSSVSITPSVTSLPSPLPRQAGVSQPVTISPVEAGDQRLPLDSTAKLGGISPPAKVGNGPVKRIGRPPKKGTHTTTSSLNSVINVESEDEEAGGASKRPRTGEKGEEPRAEAPDNGLHRFMMFGATLNPTSGIAKEMNSVLQNEVSAHSVYSPDSAPKLVGVPLPGRRRGQPEASVRSAPHTVAGMLDPSRQPQTLEELLERHWEQGSRFLMEQASHFDIASLLSSLHQLREENLGLEDSVDRLIARRDHLLAVRARLLALNSLTLGSLTQEARRDPLPVQNGPSQCDRRLVSPGRPLVSPVSRDKTQPSPRERGPAPQPSPRPPGPLPSPRDRDRSPRLPPAPHHHPAENGLDAGPGYRQHEPRVSGAAQLLTVAGLPSSVNNHRQHSPGQPPSATPAGPPKAHYTHHNSNNGPPVGRGHPEMRGHYPTNLPTNYQLVSPPVPTKGVGPPLPAHSSHSGLPLVSRSTPPGHRNTPPTQGPLGAPPPPSHHGLPPNLHPHHMRASQSSLHHKK